MTSTDDVRAPRIWSDTRLRIAGGEPLRGEVRLPELDGVTPVDDPLVDRIGLLIGTNPLLVAGAGVGGAVLGAALRSGVFGRIGGGLLGAGLGVLGGMALSGLAQLAGGRLGSESAAFVDGRPDASSTPRRGETNERVRVMDWNVRELIGSDGIVREDDAGLDALAATIERERPDMLVLQEVGQLSPIGGMGDNLAELKERLGATDAVLVPNGYRGLGKAKGQAVLTFGETRIQDARGLRHEDVHGSGVWRRVLGTPAPLRGIGPFDELPGWVLPTYMPRTTADLVVTTPGGNDVRLLDVHLSGTGGSGIGGTPNSTKAQERQLAPIAATLDAWRGPTLMMGDFNVNGGTAPQRYEVDVLGAEGMRDAATLRGIAPGDDALDSYPARGPGRGIDRIYVSDAHVDVTDLRVLNEDATARQGSDHVPLVADLVIN